LLPTEVLVTVTPSPEPSLRFSLPDLSTREEVKGLCFLSVMAREPRKRYGAPDLVPISSFPLGPTSRCARRAARFFPRGMLIGSLTAVLAATANPGRHGGFGDGSGKAGEQLVVWNDTSDSAPPVQLKRAAASVRETEPKIEGDMHKAASDGSRWAALVKAGQRNSAQGDVVFGFGP